MHQKQQSFTLIELIVVIIILGILAIVALPKFIDLTTDAEDAAAKGVLGAVNSACVLTYAQNRLHPPGTLITDGASALAALSPAPDGWTAALLTITHDGKDSKTYTITITPETGTAPCTAALTVS